MSKSNLSNSIIYKIDNKNFGINITPDLRRNELKNITGSADDISLNFTRKFYPEITVTYPENLYFLPHEIELALLRWDSEPVLHANVIEEISNHIRDNIEEIIKEIELLRKNNY